MFRFLCGQMEKEAFKKDGKEVGQILSGDSKRKIGKNASKRWSFQKIMQYRRQLRKKSINTCVGEDALPRLGRV